MRLTEVTPSAVAGFVAWLCDDQAQGKRTAEERRKAKAKKLGVPPASLPLTDDGEPPEPVRLSDKTIRNTLGPLRACLASAVREGLLRSNPAREVDLPHRPGIEADGEVVRALTRKQLETFLRVAPERHRLLFEVLAATGLRISEAVALQWQHVHLDGSSPHVKVRRAIVRDTLGPPKTSYSRRDVPISEGLVVKLRTVRRDSEWPDAEHPVFPSLSGSPLQPDNLRRRSLKPAAEEAGVPWAGFHTLRHTCASLLFAEGRNAVQVQRWLGHHSAAFTLATYVHLLDDDLGAPLTLPGANRVLTAPTPLDTVEAAAAEGNLAA
jgi:integrase